MAGNVSEWMRGTVGCGITEQTMMMTFSKVHRSKILGEIKRQGEKKKLPSHIREQTRVREGFRCQIALINSKWPSDYLIYYRLTGQAVTEAERNKHSLAVLHSSYTYMLPVMSYRTQERTAVFRWLTSSRQPAPKHTLWSQILGTGKGLYLFLKGHKHCRSDNHGPGLVAAFKSSWEMTNSESIIWYASACMHFIPTRVNFIFYKRGRKLFSTRPTK